MKRCKSDGLSKKSDGGRQKKVWVALTRCQVRMTFNPLRAEKFDAQLFCPHPALNYTSFLHKGATQEQEFQMLILKSKLKSRNRNNRMSLCVQKNLRPN